MTTLLWSLNTIMKSTHGAHNYHYYHFVLVIIMLDDNTALIFEHNYEIKSWGSQLSFLLFFPFIFFVGWQHFFDLWTQLWSQLMGLSAQRHRRLDINDANIISRLDCITKSQPKHHCNCQNEKYSWNKNKIWSQQTLSELPLQRGKEMSLKKGILMWRKLTRKWNLFLHKLEYENLEYIVSGCTNSTKTGSKSIE